MCRSMGNSSRNRIKGLLLTKNKTIMCKNNALLRTITEDDIKQTLYYEESEHNSSTYYADELYNGKYMITQDENFLKIVDSEAEAIDEVKRLSKGK